jgi:hypothetical protein
MNINKQLIQKIINVKDKMCPVRHGEYEFILDFILELL